MDHHDEGGRRGGPEHGCCGEQRTESHLDETIRLWEDTFREALRQVHVEVLKENIRKAWGKNIDTVAEDVVKALGREWALSMAREGAREELRQAVGKGFTKGPQ